MKTTSIIALIVSVIALAFGVYTVTIQRDALSTKGSAESEYVDSLAKQSVQDVINPLFSDIDEVLVFRDLSVEGTAIDAEFNQLPDEVLKNVASVVIKREGLASKRSIVYEYRANKKVYDNLPTSPSNADNSKDNIGSTEGNPVTSADSIDKPVGEVRYNQYDTIVNGKKYKKHIKTDVTYE